MAIYIQMQQGAEVVKKGFVFQSGQHNTPAVLEISIFLIVMFFHVSLHS